MLANTMLVGYMIELVMLVTAMLSRDGDTSYDDASGLNDRAGNAGDCDVSGLDNRAQTRALV